MIKLHEDTAHWNNLKPPLAPNSEEVEYFKQYTSRKTGKILLLGNTKELIGLCDVAVDLNPGDNRKSIKNNWLELGNTGEKFDIVIGDGVINLAGKELIEVISKITKTLVIRVFEKKQIGMKYATYFPSPDELGGYSEVKYITPECPIITWQFK